ncbi:MAG: multidrug efflux RND transporter permease subunit [Acidobacteriota bacterium]
MATFFVRRPIVAMVISILIVLLGLVALGRLPISQYPEITPPEVVVEGTYTGASAVDVEQSVATPIEQKVNGVENMLYMKSTNSADGKMQLRVSFEVGTDLDTANMLTQNRVAEATPTLPEEVTRFGVSTKKSLAMPMLLVTLISPNGSYDNDYLSNYAVINVNDAIARIRGVGQVTNFGGSDYAMRIWVAPDRLARYGMTIPDLAAAVRAQSVIAPAGQIGGEPAPAGTEFTYTVRTQGRLQTAREFAEIVLRTNPDGSQVRMEDVARIELGNQNYNFIGRLDSADAAVIAVYQLPGSNALDVAAQVEKTMQELAARFPDDLQYVVSLDTTLAVEAGINEIVVTLFQAIALVILVVFVFLQNVRATLIPLIAVPVSLIGALVAFPLLGFSINVLSLLGLVLAIGTVVDDAIVVVEAVMAHIEAGMSPKEATIKAMQEVSGPVVATTLVLFAVFVPVAFMAGITGRLYQQFAITIAVSVGFSSINALSLSPALSSRLLRPKGEKGSFLDPFYRAFNRAFDWATRIYTGIAAWFVHRPWTSVGLIALLAGGIVLLGKVVPAGFVPEEDEGWFLVNVQLPDAASLQRSDAICSQVETILAETTGVRSYTTIVGYSFISGSAASNNASFFVGLEPWDDRGASELHVKSIIRTLNGRFAREVPGAIVFAFGPPAIPGLGTGSGFSLMLQDRSGGTPAFLEEQARTFIGAATARPEIGGVFTAYSARVPQIFASIDRDGALKRGVTLDDVNTTLGASFGGSYINDFNRFGRLYKVYVQAEPEYRVSPEELGQFYVRNRAGDMVPLATLVELSPTTGPAYTNRFNLFRAAEIIGSPAPGYSSAQALDALEETATEVLPPEVSYSWNAMSYQEKAAAGTAGVVFAFALLCVFLILAAQYESWSLPFSVLLGTPFAVFGAFLGLWLSRLLLGESYENNVFAQIGLVMLIGLAAKNAILIVEFARAKVESGMGAVEAAIDAAKQRFRPILMTAFSFILGVLPLLVASGAGAEARKVMGMAVFAGMLLATVLGVLLVPVLFVIVEKLSGGSAPKPAAEGAEK